MNNNYYTTSTSLEEINQAISGGFTLVYLSRTDCNVCKALLPKVETMAREMEVKMLYVNLDNVSEAAGQFSIFSIPALLLFIDGREYLREVRYISIDEVARQITRFKELSS
jgi:thioredoxin-like negative regulator of GroEL